MPFAYILLCADGTFYTRSTVGMDGRLIEHEEALGANYTKKRLPVKLVWFWEFDRIDEALLWEKRIQWWSHNKKRALIEGGLDVVAQWNAAQRDVSRETATRGRLGDRRGP